jgi:hypothetical protein
MCCAGARWRQRAATWTATSAACCASCRWPASTPRSPWASTAGPWVRQAVLLAPPRLACNVTGERHSHPASLAAAKGMCTDTSCAHHPTRHWRLVSSCACSPRGLLPYAAAVVRACSCSCAGELEALCGRLSKLEAEAGGAPLLCVSEAEPADPDWPGSGSSAGDVLSEEGEERSERGDSPGKPGRREGGGEWEML